MSDLPLHPWGSRVLLREVSRDHIAETFANSKLINPNARERQQHGRWEVVAVGEGVSDVMLQPGVTALIRAWATEPIRFDGTDYRMAYEHDIVGVVTGLD